MVTICLQCGDKGFSNALVYCVKCLNFAVHRYCLDKLPETFDEFVDWACDNCEFELPNELTSSKANPIQFEGRDHTSTEDVDGQLIVVEGQRKKKKQKRNGRSLLAEEAKRRLESSPSEQPQDAELPTNFPLSTEFKKKEGSCLAANVEYHRLRPVDPITELDVTEKSNMAHELSSLEKSKEKRMEVICSSANLSEQGAKEWLEASQLNSGHLENNSIIDNNGRVQPLIEPIWSGGFCILNKDCDAFDGLVAHLSSKACRTEKVYEEARSMPSLIDLEMYPKLNVWPKSFETSGPSEDHIALYFFPSHKRYEGLFSYLVEEMKDKELALRAILKNSELLVFASNELPLRYWRFQGNYYLWGVFRGKRDSSSQAMGNHDGITEGTKLSRAKSYDAGSPLSPFEQRW